jgi:threonine/homoserine efflux transporter RhtA
MHKFCYWTVGLILIIAIKFTGPIPVATLRRRSAAVWFLGVAGSNLARGMDVCCGYMLCCPV